MAQLGTQGEQHCQQLAGGNVDGRTLILVPGNGPADEVPLLLILLGGLISKVVGPRLPDVRGAGPQGIRALLKHVPPEPIVQLDNRLGPERRRVDGPGQVRALGQGPQERLERRFHGAEPAFRLGRESKRWCKIS